MRQVVQKADGVPLFVEEMTRMVLEVAPEAAASNTAVPPLAIPDTLHALLMARLDRTTRNPGGQLELIVYRHAAT